MALLETVDLRCEHQLRGRGAGVVRAVDGVTFELEKGETLALVGESGCGKSTLGRCIAGLLPAASGEIRFAGESIGARRSRRELHAFRRRIRILFQDHTASLNPKRRIGATLAAPLQAHGMAHDSASVGRLLTMVGLDPDLIDRYPHELSGGQRQRLCIARAIGVEPELVVLDEAVSALDVSVQAQVCNLLKDLQGEVGASYLFITHDLGVARQVADRIAVMYLGRLVEVGRSEVIFNRPTHPYTEALLSAVPIPEFDRDRSARVVLEGEVPSATEPPSGCRFRTRCPYATSVCAEVDPELKRQAPDQLAACHHPRERIKSQAS
jgi:oligopeptide transport system ATP-binding protein